MQQIHQFVSWGRLGCVLLWLSIFLAVQVVSVSTPHKVGANTIFVKEMSEGEEDLAEL